MPNRRRRVLGKPSQDAPVTRAEIESVRGQLAQLVRRLAPGMTIQPIPGGGAAGDDGYALSYAGHLSALGLDIVAGPTNAPPEDHRVRWLWSDGVPVAQVFSYYDGQYAALDLETRARGTTGTDGRSLLDLHADDADGLRRAEFEVLDNPGSSPRSRVRAYAWDDARAVTEGRTIIDGDGRSQFLQLATLANRQAAFGSDSVTGDGTVTKQDTVAHGLGVAPVFAIAVCANSTQNVAVNSLDSTNVVFEFRNVNAVNWSNTFDYYWLAIG